MDPDWQIADRPESSTNALACDLTVRHQGVPRSLWIGYAPLARLMKQLQCEAVKSVPTPDLSGREPSNDG